ncbi:EscR/YscR/HrcR family type III secretion system export apparatus protein [Anaeromyxobacter diazotrophicus]|uniref:Putative translocation protein y4yL n=1 Tax=Anaeromyxobacter diazotrophicus TaxID=2590199 RepID=A0A7I9VGV3_9BACT|nr:EscR/YscR/HrcR family type III secretion system export apparatus protein [Anaeromyxobacter diazotrophicus]GEJ55575.1 putative translocation protein y4yL [Anaeromyxobacter diazotrophicus]
MTPLALAAPPAGLAERPADLLVLLGAAALVPAGLVVLTSFLKMAVVLSLTRSALGAPQIPPSSAVTGLALLLTLVVMAPVAEESWRLARAVPAGGIDRTLEAAAAAAEPLRGFLGRFARPDDRETFLELARRARPPGGRAAVGGTDFAVLAPAFVVSELRRAFTIGFLVFLPFLVVDLLAANVLLALGLTQLSPTTVALPFKLLLFVAVDGWKLVARGLVLGYLA